MGSVDSKSVQGMGRRHETGAASGRALRRGPNGSAGRRVRRVVVRACSPRILGQPAGCPASDAESALCHAGAQAAWLRGIPFGWLGSGRKAHQQARNPTHSGGSGRDEQKEWDVLRQIGAWNEKQVQERDIFRKGALSGGAKVHVGRVFGICAKQRARAPSSSKVMQE